MRAGVDTALSNTSTQDFIMSERELDIVIFGATGFAGRLVAEYLAERHADTDVRWAMGGRNRKKLEAVRAEIAAKHPRAAEAPLVVADSADRASLDAMVARTKVVCTTVGPYAKYGTELVAACVAGGAHYCDLTGEPQFIRRMIDEHHADAVAAGVRIVHCCGFDSIPSDIGTFALQEELIALDGEPADEALFFLLGASGGFSGGTVASLINVMQEANDPLVRKVLVNPYALNPEDSRKGPKLPSPMSMRKDPVTGWWGAPFLMAPINERVVRRSHALMSARFGEGFRYGELTRTGKGMVGFASAAGMSGGMGAMMGLIAFPPTRKLLERFVLPAPGEGPSREAIEKGYFKVVISGRRDGKEVGRVEVRGKRDPGYGATACMLGESALCLALDPLDSPGGIVTPASAMGAHIRKRLDATDVQFTFTAAS